MVNGESLINRAILRMNYGEFYDRYRWSYGGPINGIIVGGYNHYHWSYGLLLRAGRGPYF